MAESLVTTRCPVEHCQICNMSQQEKTTLKGTTVSKLRPVKTGLPKLPSGGSEKQFLIWWVYWSIQHSYPQLLSHRAVPVFHCSVQKVSNRIRRPHRCSCKTAVETQFQYISYVLLLCDECHICSCRRVSWLRGRVEMPFKFFAACNQHPWWFTL